MMSLVSGDVVWTPYPYVESNRLRSRPALVIASGLGADGALCWALMITNAVRPEWPGDVIIPDHGSVGLPIPSKIRTEKIATLETARANWLGRLDPVTLERVKLAIQAILVN